MKKTASQKQPDKPKQAPHRPRTRTPEQFDSKTLKRIDKLAECQVKDATIAQSIDVEHTTFKRMLSHRLEQKRALGQCKLTQKQYDMCFKPGAGQLSALIWAGKQHLGQSDHGPTDVDLSTTQCTSFANVKLVGYDAQGNRITTTVDVKGEPKAESKAGQSELSNT